MPSQEEISSMEKLKQIMEGKKPSGMAPKQNNTPSYIPEEKNITDDMTKILERMYGSQKNNTVENQYIERPVKEVLYESKEIPKVNYKSSETRIIVELYPNSNVRKLYSVIDESGNIIHGNLNLFETAQLIQEAILSKNQNISNLLKKDKEYEKLINECFFFKSKIKRCTELSKYEENSQLTEAKVNLEVKANNALKEADSIMKDLRKQIKLF